jgi:hypothetical protein
LRKVEFTLPETDIAELVLSRGVAIIALTTLVRSMSMTPRDAKNPNI